MKETGCSGKLESASSKVLAGIAIEPPCEASTLRTVVMVVSISLAEIVSSLLRISNKKQSKIGMVLLEFKTPPMDFKCFNKVVEDITKFIADGLMSFSGNMKL
jgi:hypothetical protein